MLNMWTTRFVTQTQILGLADFFDSDLDFVMTRTLGLRGGLGFDNLDSDTALVCTPDKSRFDTGH